MFPFDMFSIKIQRLFMLSPFPYMAFVPAKVISDTHFDMQMAYHGLAISCVWLCVLISIAVVMYRRGILRYTVKGV
jgi:ABC-2 type transport system permease protein